jgi:acyl carrier protein
MNMVTAVNMDVREVSRHDVANRLAKILCDVLRLQLSPQDLSDDTSLYELGLESLKVVELLSTIEKVFGIVVDVEDLSAELFVRLGNVTDFVVRKLQEAR